MVTLDVTIQATETRLEDAEEAESLADRLDGFGMFEDNEGYPRRRREGVRRPRRLRIRIRRTDTRHLPSLPCAADLCWFGVNVVQSRSMSERHRLPRAPDSLPSYLAEDSRDKIGRRSSMSAGTSMR